MILVTGASGFIGSHLVRHLSRSGAEVRGIVRSAEADEIVRRNGATETATADLRDRDAVAEAVAGCDLVYHLAGPHRGNRDELFAAHVDGTDAVVSSLEDHARLVHVSSTAVYGWSPAWPADEQTPTRPESAYGEAKLAAERIVRLRCANAVIARPTIVYGTDDRTGMLPRVVELLRSGRRAFPGDGRNRIHLLHIDDLCRALVLLGERGTGTFVLCGPAPTTMREVLEAAAEGAGSNRPIFVRATRPAAAIAWAMERLWSATARTGEPPLTRHSLNVAVRDRSFTSDRAETELGWTPAVETVEGVEEVARQLAAHEAQAVPGPAWRRYLDDPDEGLGTVYERFMLNAVIERAVERTGATSILHAPVLGMTGIPGLELVEAARKGVRVGLADVDPERLDAVVGLWRRLGLDPEQHLLAADPRDWPPIEGYDLVFSFAALWWFDRWRDALAAQARWASVGVLACVPNQTPFMRLRARTWHRRMFHRLHLDALDTANLEGVAARNGLLTAETGLFDIPPFPDTAVPLAHLVRRRSDGDTWRWSILPYLQGDQPELPDRIERLTVLERSSNRAVRRALAHHRYMLFTR